MAITYDEYISRLNPLEQEFVFSMNEFLQPKGYKTDIKQASQGPVISFITPKTKRTVFNCVFRKSGLFVRIYADNIMKYQEFIQTLPEEMLNSINKASECRMCNSRCPKGYHVNINGNDYNKCRYGAFMFGLTAQTMSFIKEFIVNEVKYRQ